MTLEEILALSERLHPKGEWQYCDLGSSIHLKDNWSYMIADVRGWGHLTGCASLKMSDEDAIKHQYNTGQMIAAIPDMVELLKTQDARIKSLEAALQETIEYCKTSDYDDLDFGRGFVKIGRKLEALSGDKTA